MEVLINYKFRDFLKQDPELIHEYITYLEFIKPIDTFQDVFYMKLKHVDFIKDNLMESDVGIIVKIISMVQKISTKEVYNMEIITLYGLLNSIRNQIDTIVQAELNSLCSNHANFKWESVNGSEKLHKFGIYNTLESVSNGDITKWKSIMNIPYSDIFTKMYMDRVKADLQMEMEQIK